MGRTLRNGDKVNHWRWGEGEIIKAPATRDEVPKEWQPVWPVVMVQFWHWNIACMWVLDVHLDVIDVA